MNHEKITTTLLVLLFVTLLISLIFYPNFSPTLSIIIFILTIGTAVFLAIYHNRQSKEQNELTNIEFVRNTVIDLLGLALTMGSAIWIGRLAGIYAGQAWGILMGIVAALLTGFIAAFVVGRVWNKISSPLRASA